MVELNWAKLVSHHPRKRAFDMSQNQDEVHFVQKIQGVKLSKMTPKGGCREAKGT